MSGSNGFDDDLPGDDLLDELEDDADEDTGTLGEAAPDLDVEESEPDGNPSDIESKADRVWGILLGGIPQFLFGLILAVAGILVWNFVVIGIGGLVAFLGFLLYAASYVPPGVVLWRRLLIKSAQNYRKATSADAIGFIFRASGKVDPRAVKYLGSDTDDRTGKWATKSTGEKWGAGVEGSSVDLLGKAPVVFFDEEDPDRVTAKYGRMTEAIDMGQTRPLYANAQIDEVVVEKAIYPEGVQAPQQGDDADPAVADGGNVQPKETTVIDREYRIPNGGQLADKIVDLSSPEGCSGGRVSFEKAKELRSETAETEEMQRQEDRGRIAEMKRGADRKFVLKVMLIAAGIIGTIYLGPMIVQGIFGGGGGGGGSIVPIMISALPGVL